MIQNMQEYLDKGEGSFTECIKQGLPAEEAIDLLVKLTLENNCTVQAVQEYCANRKPPEGD